MHWRWRAKPTPSDHTACYIRAPPPEEPILEHPRLAFLFHENRLRSNKERRGYQAQASLRFECTT